MSNKPGFFRQLKGTQNYSTKFLIVLFSPNSGVTPNTQKSQTRNTVERVFGHFKLHYGMSKARHLGLMQFHTSTVLASIVHNLKTALGLKQKYGLA